MGPERCKAGHRQRIKLKCAEYEEEKDKYSTTVNVVLKATYFKICDFYERNLNTGIWNGQLQFKHVLWVRKREACSGLDSRGCVKVVPDFV